MTIKMNITTKDDMEVLTTALQNDDDYAWSWHCNIAVTAMDVGTTHEIANNGAARFMSLCFDVDTSKFDEYEYMFKKDKNG